MFFGRTRQLVELAELWEKDSASLVSCQGRRRIGKSRLVEEFALRSGARLIAIAGLSPQPEMTNDDQLKAFGRQLAAQVGGSDETPQNWTRAFRLLDGCLDNRRKTVVLLDEISWLGGYDPNFPGELKNAWDMLFRKRRKLVFVICGSVSSWITENILNNTGFAGRFSLQLVLPELPLRDCIRFWGKRADRLATREIFDVLSVTGGVPKYLEEVKPSRSAEENISRLCFRPSGTLFRDFSQIFADIFGERAVVKRAILTALAEGPKTGLELAAVLKTVRNGHLSAHLDELELAGFVAKDSGLNPETGQTARQDRYRLRDNYTRFYLRYIEPRTAEIKAGLVREAPLETLPGWETVLGLQFENLILNQVTELLPLVGFGGLPVLSAAPWRTRGKGKGEGLQIDLLLQTRKSVCVVEIKRRRRIGEEVEAEVDRKVRALRVRPGISVRTALVYEGELAPVVLGNGYFDAIVPASKLLGL